MLGTGTISLQRALHARNKTTNKLQVTFHSNIALVKDAIKIANTMERYLSLHHPDTCILLNTQLLWTLVALEWGLLYLVEYSYTYYSLEAELWAPRNNTPDLILLRDLVIKAWGFLTSLIIWIFLERGTTAWSPFRKTSSQELYVLKKQIHRSQEGLNQRTLRRGRYTETS